MEKMLIIDYKITPRRLLIRRSIRAHKNRKYTTAEFPHKALKLPSVIV